jgi:ankyrin repeat protein
MELSSIAELCEPSPEGQKQLIAQLHSRGLQALVKSSNGTTALHRLCENKQLTSDVLQVALQNDIISDAMVTLKRGEDDWTPLELLCGNSGLDCRWLRVMNDGSESSSAGWLTKRFKITLPAGPHQIYGRDTFLHHLCKNKNITYETLKYANLSANEWS